MASDPAAMQEALETSFERLNEVFDDASFERRSDLIIVRCPSVPTPQFNGVWVVADSKEAVEALPEALAEVEATGAWACVQTRSGHPRTQHAAAELGLTDTERLPGMVIRPGELVEPAATIEIGLIAIAERDVANDLLATSFGAPREIFERLSELVARADEASWYVGRVGDGVVVSTAVGVTHDHSTAVYNVATAPEHRGRGYGAALTARAVRDGFDGGAEFAYLQSSKVAHRLYRRLGFRDVAEYLLLTRPAPGP